MYLIALFLALVPSSSVETFSIETIDGETISVADGMHLTVVYIWEPKVEDVVNEFESLNTIASQHKGKSVQFIAVCTKKVEKVTAYLEQRALNYHHVAGKEAKRVTKALNLNGIVKTIPRHIVIGKDGEILQSAAGSCNTIHTLVEEALK